VLQALNTGIIPEGWNETAIVLIPEVESPELITQFRPISLCNVIYKIVSKCLVNRLRPILQDIMAPPLAAPGPCTGASSPRLLRRSAYLFLVSGKPQDGSLHP
jgi:hypothetical protein